MSALQTDETKNSQLINNDTLTFKNSNPCSLHEELQVIPFRLEKAFQEAGRYGIMTDAATSGCVSCSYAAMDAVEDVNPTGYAVVTSQSVREHAATIRFSTVEDSCLSTVDVGDIVTGVLDKHELEYEWDGTEEDSIIVCF